MRERANAILRRLGAPGVIGIGVLLAAGGFYVSALKPLQQQVDSQKVMLERLRLRQPIQTVASGGRGDELRRFYSLFPPASELTDQLEKIFALARRSGVELAQGEYRLERRDVGLWAYRASLPARGSYPQLRNFLASVLKDVPTASLDGVRFERKRAAEAVLDAQVRVTLHVRPSGDTP